MSTEPDAPSAPAKPGRRRAGFPTRLVAYLGVLAAGLLIGWVVFGGVDHDDASSGVPAGAESQRVATDTRDYPGLGLTFGLPATWRTSFRGAVLTAASPDDTVSVALSNAGGPRAGKSVRRADREELTRIFGAAEQSRSRAKVGTASTVVTELIGVTRNRKPIRILSMGASSRWRTYSIQVFTVPRPVARRIAELRTLLASVRYRKPS
jgi:hypothetical protein